MIKKLLSLCLISFTTMSCSTVVIKDSQVRTHWMKKGEPAPYDGVLLNSYTFLKLLEKAQACGGRDGDRY